MEDPKVHQPDGKQRLVWANDLDLEEKLHEDGNKGKSKKGFKHLFVVAFSTLGMVYGDIGTSPLYVYSSTFPNGAPQDDNRILGAFSMIFWTLTVVVLVKYVLLMLRADDNGEGGIISLYSLIKRAAGLPTLTHLHPGGEDFGEDQDTGKLATWFKTKLRRSHWQQISLLVLVLLAVNMIISDGVLTPAISVISAVEGIQYNAALSDGAVIGITCAILVLLFFIQPFGTQKISFIFSPIILLWLVANAAIGAYNIAKFNPSVAKGLSPHYIYYYWSGDAPAAWRTLGSIMLSITGAEALYADMGHFSAKAIQLSFLTIVYPSLVLTYLGQTAFITANRELSVQAFWASIPKPVYVPMVILAALAAIIASQAMITGAFSITKQGIAIRCFPRFTVRHTSAHNEGQVYIPEINYSLMVGCLIIVAAFQNSGRIGNAYGLAIISVMIIDTLLLAMVMLMSWNWHPAIVGAFFLFYTFISGAYLSSNLEKIPHGAWFSIVLAGILSIISYVYWWGRATKATYIRNHIVPLSDLFEPGSSRDNPTSAPPVPHLHLTPSRGGALSPPLNLPLSDDAGALASSREDQDSGLTVHLHPGIKPLRLAGTKLPVARLPGLGLYYSECFDGVPPVLVRFLSLSPAIHEAVVLVTIRRVLLPTVPSEQRLLVRKLDVEGFYHVVARYGYLEDIHQGQEFVGLMVDEILEYLNSEGMQEAMSQASFGDAERGGSGPSTLTTIMAAADGLAPRLSTTSEISKINPSPGASLSTATGQHLLAQIQARLRGEQQTGVGSPQLTRDSTAPRSPFSGFSQSGSGEGSRRGKSPRSNAYVTGTTPIGNTMGTATKPLPLPGQAPINEYPWVRQPSVFNRVRGVSLGTQDRAKFLAALAERDVSATMPLPPPPSRPCIHRLSGPVVSLPAGKEEDEAGVVHQSTLRRVQTPLETPSATISGRNAELLRRRLQEEQAKVEENVDHFAAERNLLLAAYSHGVVHLLGRAELKAPPHGSGITAWIKRFVIDGLYAFLVANSRPAAADYGLPIDTLLEMRVRYQVE